MALFLRELANPLFEERPCTSESVQAFALTATYPADYPLRSLIRLHYQAFLGVKESENQEAAAVVCC